MMGQVAISNLMVSVGPLPRCAFWVGLPHCGPIVLSIVLAPRCHLGGYYTGAAEHPPLGRWVPKGSVGLAPGLLVPLSNLLAHSRLLLPFCVPPLFFIGVLECTHSVIAPHGLAQPLFPPTLSLPNTWRQREMRVASSQLAIHPRS